MECVKIRGYFSEYLDGTLDEQTANLVEVHVETCGGCKKELGSLQSLVQELGNLEQVEAPKEFLEQVHARMAKRFDIRSLTRTLLIPFRINLPYRFAAAAAMAVLIFFIIHTPEIEKEMTGIPEFGEFHEGGEGTDSDHIPGLSREEEAPSPTPDSNKPQITEQVSKRQFTAAPQRTKPSGIASSRKKSLERPQLSERVVLQEPEYVKSESKFSMGKAVKPVELALLLGSKVPKSNNIPRIGDAMDIMAASEKMKPSELRSSQDGSAVPMSSSSLMKRDSLDEDQAEKYDAEGVQKQKDGAITEDLPPDDSFSNVNDLIIKIKGAVLSTEYDKNTGQPKFIIAEIPAKQYGLFCEKLQQLGTLQSPAPAIETKSLEHIRIRIRLIRSSLPADNRPNSH